MLEFDKFLPKFWGCYGSRFTDQEKIEALAEQNKEMEAWFIKKIGSGTFLNGTDTPSQIDIHCYVMMERLVMFEHTCFEGAKSLKV